MSACQQAPLLPARPITVLQCQPVTPCTMPAMAPLTNGELRDSLDVARAAWARCAAKVDMIVDCQAQGLAGGERHD
ncbi:MAG TPA: Rz1-like lysis system protein LysC [Trinickia sp.]|nr:Rz1-like lysis system protein LysC [Trinickia sp.]